jgi:7-carboxy-7-deazaguanine synthase
VRIAEIYKSIQGEGRLTGTESIFVRTSGCNLRCWFCDTPYASWQPEGSDLSTFEILNEVQRLDSHHVVVTGGEPMLFAELIPFCDSLGDLRHHITIETAGTLYLPVRCDLMSISPKLSNSAPDASEYPKWHGRHEESRYAPDVIRRLIDEFDYQFKFVIENAVDVDEVMVYLGDFPQVDLQQVLLMPQARTVEEQDRIAEWLRPRCAASGLRYCPRKQIEWFGLSRGS